MLYGEPGIGKTVLAGSADAVAEMRPVLFIDMEGGTESLRHTYPDVEVVRVKNWREMQALYNALADSDHGYQTIVIDSLSEAQKFNMLHIMADVAANNAKMIEEVPSMREWGINLEQMRKFVRGFRDLEVNTIFTCLAAKDKDIRTGKFTYGPALSGKLAGEIAGFLDEVFFMYMKEGVNEETGDEEQLRMLLTGKTETTIAKDRSGKLDQIIMNPTMEKLYSLMSA
ncbi:Gp70 protein [Candidatus Vecturithrix granuli]|uniref:Gp70 protein n=1 Tax=Vecturithrix granuli TaxID=1499967 RepID=A0A081CB03_VECG1|nr:Gp70 protein [Candidatus Vecturithrix granuli]